MCAVPVMVCKLWKLQKIRARFGVARHYDAAHGWGRGVPPNSCHARVGEYLYRIFDGTHRRIFGNSRV